MKNQSKYKNASHFFVSTFRVESCVGGIGFVGDYSPLHGRHARAEISLDRARQHFSHDSRLGYARPQFHPHQGFPRRTNFERRIGTTIGVDDVESLRNDDNDDNIFQWRVSFFGLRPLTGSLS